VVFFSHGLFSPSTLSVAAPAYVQARRWLN
jgi:hypothetical protein